MRTPLVAISVIFILCSLIFGQAALAVDDSTYLLADGYSEWEGANGSRFESEGTSNVFTYGDNEIVTYPLPTWTFDLYGVSYSSITASTDGTIKLGAAATPFITAINDDLDSSYYGGVFIEDKIDHVVIEWRTESFVDAGYGLINNFAVILFQDGTIRYDYNYIDPLATLNDAGSGMDADGADVNGISLPLISSASSGQSYYVFDKVGDFDGDGLTNEAEILAGINPASTDTDGDGLLDGNDAFPLYSGIGVPPPSSLNVPAISRTGDIYLSWAPSSASGVTYVVDQSADGGSPYTNIYSGTDTFINVTGADYGTYTFWVKATLAGYPDSEWVIGNQDCIVSPPYLRILGDPTIYNNIQEAYNAASDGATIQVMDLSLIENFNANQNKSVYLEGGYNFDYSDGTGVTKMKGAITTTFGTIFIKNFELQK